MSKNFTKSCRKNHGFWTPCLTGWPIKIIHELRRFMRLLLLNLNYLQYQFFIKTMPKKSWILNTLPNGGNLHHKYIQLGVITPHICASLRGLANSCATKYKNHCSYNFSVRESHKSGFSQHIYMLIILNQTFKLLFFCPKKRFPI